MSCEFGPLGQLPGGGGGGGDVTGPASATDNAICRFDGTSGKDIQNSLCTIDDAGTLTAPVVVTGDLEMRCPERDAHWLFKEHRDYIEVSNLTTGQRYRLALIPDRARVGFTLKRALAIAATLLIGGLIYVWI